MLEKPAFKIAAIAMALGLTTVCVGGFLFWAHHKNQERERAAQAKREAIFEYETRFRGNLVRVYQNLKLDHFLAAYNNLEDIEAPPAVYADIYREYHEVLWRIAKGLLETDFLNESEALFLKLQNSPEYEDRARESIIQIASRRRWQSARAYLEEGRKLLIEKRYRDASQEFRKSKTEYESVRLFKIHDVSAELAELAQLNRDAQFYIYYQEARETMEQARLALKNAFYQEAQEKIQRAGSLVVQAAFYGGLRPEAETLRQELVRLEAELAYRVPNALPVWNRIPLAEREAHESFFNLKSVQIEQTSPPKILLQYAMRLKPGDFFIVRYKVHLYDGRMFFDGRILREDSVADDARLYLERDTPATMRSVPVKKIEIRIYDSSEQLISSVQRAFRSGG